MSSQLDRLQGAIGQLAGKEIWGVVASPPTEADAHLKIGKKWRVPYENIPDRPWNIGEYGLFVMCAWRLEERGQIAHSSTEAESDEDGLIAGLERMTGRRIEMGSASDNGWDLVLGLDGGLRFSVSCDQTAKSDAPYCYQLAAGTMVFNILQGGKLEVAERFTAQQLAQLEELPS